MGNALNRQRYLMAQGYTYKVLVNITKGLNRKEMESIPGMKYLNDSERLKYILTEVVLQHGSEH